MGTFSTVGSAGEADPALLEILRAAAAASPYSVEAFSGARPNDSGSQHQHGGAVDIVLIDPNTGQEIPNYNAGGAAYQAYERFAMTARQVQTELHPDLSDDFRWGGWFNQGGPDLMHFDAGGSENMALGSWETGLNAQGREVYSSDRVANPMVYSGTNGTRPATAGEMRVANLYGQPGYQPNLSPAGIQAYAAAPMPEAQRQITAMSSGRQSDPAVVAMQEQLNAAGANLVVDGIMGPRTGEALRAFQSSQGLPATGQADGQTHGVLMTVARALAPGLFAVVDFARGAINGSAAPASNLVPPAAGATPQPGQEPVNKRAAQRDIDRAARENGGRPALERLRQRLRLAGRGETPILDSILGTAPPKTPASPTQETAMPLGNRPRPAPTPTTTPPTPVARPATLPAPVTQPSRALGQTGTIPGAPPDPSMVSAMLRPRPQPPVPIPAAPPSTLVPRVAPPSPIVAMREAFGRPAPSVPTTSAPPSALVPTPATAIQPTPAQPGGRPITVASPVAPTTAPLTQSGAGTPAPVGGRPAIAAPPGGNPITVAQPGGPPITAAPLGGRPVTAAPPSNLVPSVASPGGRPVTAAPAGGVPVMAAPPGGRPVTVAQPGGPPITAAPPGGRPLTAAPAGGAPLTPAPAGGQPVTFAPGGPVPPPSALVPMPMMTRPPQTPMQTMPTPAMTSQVPPSTIAPAPPGKQYPYGRPPTSDAVAEAEKLLRQPVPAGPSSPKPSPMPSTGSIPLQPDDKDVYYAEQEAQAGGAKGSPRPPKTVAPTPAAPAPAPAPVRSKPAPVASTAAPAGKPATAPATSTSAADAATAKAYEEQKKKDAAAAKAAAKAKAK